MHREPQLEAKLPAQASKLLWFCPTTPGLEAVAAAELTALGCTPRVVHAGLEVAGGFDLPELLCLHARTIESLRVRLKGFAARDFAGLEQGLLRLPWAAYLSGASRVHLSAVCHKSRLYHSEAVAERCHRVLEQVLRRPIERAARRAAEQTVFLRLVRDEVEVSIDASGALLHRRGDRTHVGKAPIRETVAAGLVRMLNEAAPSVERLWDPFCGSGTLLLEWLQARLGHAAGARRGFAFESWAAYRSRLPAWLEKKEQATPRGQQGELFALGSDTDARAGSAAEHNLAHAELGAHFRFLQGDFEVIGAQVPAGTAILTNPPYGVRLRAGDLGQLYGRWERFVERRADLRPVVMVTGFKSATGRTALPWKRLSTLRLGGVSAQVWLLAR